MLPWQGVLGAFIQVPPCQTFLYAGWNSLKTTVKAPV